MGIIWLSWHTKQLIASCDLATAGNQTLAANSTSCIDNNKIIDLYKTMTIENKKHIKKYLCLKLVLIFLNNKSSFSFDGVFVNCTRCSTTSSGMILLICSMESPDKRLPSILRSLELIFPLCNFWVKMKKLRIKILPPCVYSNLVIQNITNCLLV